MNRLIPAILFSAVLAAFGQNRLTDLSLRLPDGSPLRIPERGTDFTLLLIFDPDCEECHAVADSLASSPVIAEAVETGLLTMVTAYPGENDTGWRTRISAFPGSWINGIDRAMVLLDRFNFTIAPVLYLYAPGPEPLLNETTVKTAISCLEPHIFPAGHEDY